MSNKNTRDFSYEENDYSKQNRYKAASHEFLVFRPKTLPEGWGVIEQRDSYETSYTSFIRWGKIHHNAEPSMLWVVFNQFNPHLPGRKIKFPYSVKAGRNIKPGESLKTFTDMKDVETYMIYLMEKTDKWLEEINSEKYIQAYNDRIAKLVEADEKKNLKRNSKK